MNDVALRVDAEQCRRSLKRFGVSTWGMVEPVSFIDDWYVDFMCEILTALWLRQLRRVVINIPPSYGKSFWSQCAFPSWIWANDPRHRMMFSTYADELSSIWSVKRRDLIASPWYQNRYGDSVTPHPSMWEKDAFANTAMGRMMAVTMGSSSGFGSATTGFHCDGVCLRGDTAVVTDQGEIPIAQIVEGRLPVRVLGSSGRWQQIERYERHTGRPLLEICTDRDDTLVCTEDHPLFLDNVGFKQSVSVLDSAYGDIRLLRLREGSESCAQARCPRFGGVLLAAMRQYWDIQHAMEGWAANAGMQAMRYTFSGVHRGEEGQEVLLASMLQQGPASFAANHPMPGLRDGLCAEEYENLFSRMRGEAASVAHTRGAERSLYERRLALELCPRFYGQAEAVDRGSRWQRLRELLRGRLHLADSPYRRVEGQSRAYQPGNALHPLPPDGSYQDRNQCPMDETVRIASVHRLPAPDYVYNLSVAPDHDYYAARVLTHNCVDDPMKAAEANQKVANTKAVDFIRGTLSSRLADKERGFMWCVMQRLGMNDPTAYLREEAGWDHFEIQGISERKTIIVFPLVHPVDERRPECEYDEDGHRIIERPADSPCDLHSGADTSAECNPQCSFVTNDSALSAKRESRRQLEQTRKDMTDAVFQAQYQQNPTPKGGAFIKRDWIQYWEELPRQFDQMVQVWDLTFTDTARSDWCVGQVWGRLGPKYFLVDQVRMKMTLLKSMDWIKGMRRRYPRASTTLIEARANGPAVMNLLQHKLSGLIPYNPDRDKLARLALCQEDFESKSVLFPTVKRHPWIRTLVDRLCGYAGQKNYTDDEIDCITMAIARLKQSSMSSYLSGPEGVDRRIERNAEAEFDITRFDPNAFDQHPTLGRGAFDYDPGNF